MRGENWMAINVIRWELCWFVCSWNILPEELLPRRVNICPQSITRAPSAQSTWSGMSKFDTLLTNRAINQGWPNNFWSSHILLIDLWHLPVVWSGRMGYIDNLRVRENLHFLTFVFTITDKQCIINGLWDGMVNAHIITISCVLQYWRNRNNISLTSKEGGASRCVRISAGEHF